MEEEIEKFRNQKVRLRTSSYSGRGRPKKSDFAIMKVKDVLDFEMAEMINNGFTTQYTN